MFCYHIVLNYWSPLFTKFFNIHSGLNFILDSGLGDMVEPMVWHYLSDFRLPIGNHTCSENHTIRCVFVHTSQHIVHTSQHHKKLYTQVLHVHITDIWDKYSKVFPNIWFASAFKGATGANAYATNIAYHLDNHTVWLDVMAREGSKFKKVQGCALTGWQR